MSDLTVPVQDQDHIQGSEDAPVTLVEYGDFECPTCGQAYPIVKHVQKHFGDRLRFVYRHFPLPQHTMAEPAAEASEFADTQGKFWAMHDALYENQEDLSTDLFVELAGNLRLNEKALEKALDRTEFAERIEADMESGEDAGVHGTPTFFINGKQHQGSFGVQQLIAAIEAAGAE
jgi:protein-disulfide isomerase